MTKAVSTDGIVKGAPDATWRFVVEVPTHVPPTPETRWVYVATFDTQEEAVNYASAMEGPVRVRSFKQQHFPQDHGIAVHVFKPPSPTPAPNSTQAVECIDHPEQKGVQFKGGQSLRCPICRTAMVTQSWAAKVRAL